MKSIIAHLFQNAAFREIHGKAAHVAPRKTLDGSCTAVCCLTPAIHRGREMCKILAWPGYQSQLPSIAKMPKFPLPFRGLKAETPDLLGINALAYRLGRSLSLS